jgi:type IV secretory pathway VirB4 component
MLVVGRSGAGKTTFFYNMMDLCREKDLPFWVFDFKNDYRHVVDEFDLTVLHWRDFKFNPLQPPPGVRLERLAEVLADVFAHAVGMWKAR